MSSSTNQDITVQGYSVESGVDGFTAALKAYREGTDEVKCLILNEMSVIYECCYCRNMFRSLPNFIAHKRRYCRSRVSSIREEKEAAETSDGRGARRPGRDPTALRQYNFIKKFYDRVEETPVTLPLTKNEITLHTLPKISKPAPLTTIRDGYQSVVDIPINLAIKERIPEDRVVFVTPIDRSSRYGEMNLRRRKHPDGVSTSRLLSIDDLTLFEQVPEQLKKLADVSNLSCQSAKCKREVAPFTSLPVLIYHFCIRHQQPVNGQFICFLCKPSPRLRNHDLLKEHLKQVHEDVRMQHIQDRKTIDQQKDAFKRTGRYMKAKTVSPSRHRSISPDSVDSEFDDADSPIPDDDMPLLQDETSNPSNESSPKKTRSQTSSPHRRKAEHPMRLRSLSPSVPSKEGRAYSHRDEQILSKEDAERIDRMLHKYKGSGGENSPKESSPESNTSTGNTESDDDSPMPQLERAQRNRKPSKRFQDFVMGSPSAKSSQSSQELPESSDSMRMHLGAEQQRPAKVPMSPPKILRPKRRITGEDMPDETKRHRSLETPGSTSQTNGKPFEESSANGPDKNVSRDAHDAVTDRAASVPPVGEATPAGTKTLSTGATLPSVVVGRHSEDDHFYSKMRRSVETPPQGKPSTANGVTPAAPSTSSAARRKQSFSGIVLEEGEGSAPLPPVPEDLSEVPVYLTEAQRDVYFSPLRPLFTNAKDGLHQCSECGAVLRSLLEGRRHMVSHIRAVRIVCTLCDAGSFFCTDMRIHLMYRHCENLHLAPPGYVIPGHTVPCMDKKKADKLARIADPRNPGRVVVTKGKIVSCSNPKAYVPDQAIESRILNAHRMPTPKKPAPAPTQSASRVHLVPSILTQKDLVQRDQRPPKLEAQVPQTSDAQTSSVRTTITLD